MDKYSLQSVWVRILLVLTLGWLLFAVLFDTFTGRILAFGPGNYRNVVGGIGQIFFLVSVQFLSFTIILLIILYLVAWLRDEYRLFLIIKNTSKKK